MVKHHRALRRRQLKLTSCVLQFRFLWINEAKDDEANYSEEEKEVERCVVVAVCVINDGRADERADEVGCLADRVEQAEVPGPS